MSHYDAIIHLPHHVSEKYPQMSIADRAAQFAPFAALTGYGAAIEETGRRTDQKLDLDEYEKAALNEQLTDLQARWKDQPIVRITYFVPDDRKAGGAYRKVAGAVKKIDIARQAVILTDGTVILFENILTINEDGNTEVTP